MAQPVGSQQGISQKASLSWLTGVEKQYVETGSVLPNHAVSRDEENWLFSAVCPEAVAAGRRKEA
jgi:hypothetical protein